MKKETYIVTILDRSGSMQSMLDEAIGGFNAFLRTQKEDKTPAKLRVVLFDHEQQIYYSGPLHDAPEMSRTSYVPRGTTAYYDALGWAIKEVGEELDKLPEAERPERVVVCVMTDGMENASKEFTRGRVKDMVAHQESKYNWNFIFLAANLDAAAAAANIGIRKRNSLTYDNNEKGMKGAYAAMSTYMRGVRSGKAIDLQDASDSSSNAGTPGDVQDKQKR